MPTPARTAGEPTVMRSTRGNVPHHRPITIPAATYAKTLDVETAPHPMVDIEPVPGA